MSSVPYPSKGKGGKGEGKGCIAGQDYTALAVASGFLIPEHASGALAREAHAIRERDEALRQREIERDNQVIEDLELSIQDFSAERCDPKPALLLTLTLPVHSHASANS